MLTLLQRSGICKNRFGPGGRVGSGCSSRILCQDARLTEELQRVAGEAEQLRKDSELLGGQFRVHELQLDGTSEVSLPTRGRLSGTSLAGRLQVAFAAVASPHCQKPLRG